MKGITPCLWFNNNTEEAVGLYTSLFKNASLGRVTHYPKDAAKATKMPEGAVMTIAFTLGGQDFLALNGGPYYQHTPAISLFVHCDSAEEADGLWKGLSDGGKVLMELAKYPFSEKFGWLQDRFGVSWQINLGPSRQKIGFFLLFVKEQHGRAEEALQFYVSQFDDATIVKLDKFGSGEHEPEGTLKQGIITLCGSEFMAMDSAMNHQFAFTGAISFMVNCDTQEEIDAFWQKLPSGGGKEIQCGWIQDKFGVSWQIVPAILGKLHDSPKKVEKVMQAVMQMGKLDIKKMEEAAQSAG